MSIVARHKLWSFFESLYSQELTEESPRAVSPPWLKIPLLRHQESAIAAALNLERAKTDGIDVGRIAGDSMGGKFYTSYGVLGDKVGSGKSLTALALVKAPAPLAQYTEFLNRGVIHGDGRDIGLLRTRSQLKTANGQELVPVNASLFLVPHALIAQWETYALRDTTLRCKFIKKRMEAAHESALSDLDSYDAVFVSSTMWATLKQFHAIRTVLWKRIFIDEADSISITTDHDDLHGLFYWFITASWWNLVFANGSYFNISSSYIPLPETPQTVVDRVVRLQGGTQYLSIPGCRHMNIVRRMCGITNGYSSISINAVGYQSSRLIIHSSEEYIKSSFASPAVTHTNILCSTPANIRVLDSFITADMLERLNAGDVHGALESIGMSAQSTTEITTAVTKSLMKDLEQAKLTHEYKKSMEYSSEAVKAKALEACEQRIASLESRISAIQDRIQRATEQNCPICYCDVNNPAVTPCCQQLFCFPCLCESLKRVAACPLCRTRIHDLKEIQVVGEKTEPKAKEEIMKTGKVNKKDTFVRFMKEHKTAKVLMFSGYDATFTGMNTVLDTEGITYAIVNGSQARITKLLREFKSGKYNVLFLNARNMGAGLNIECATHVMLFHRMSSELEAQIVGRAMRLGRKEPLEVVHLLHDNEAGNTISHV